jgi:hypothetical protein
VCLVTRVRACVRAGVWLPRLFAPPLGPPSRRGEQARGRPLLTAGRRMGSASQHSSTSSRSRGGQRSGDSLASGGRRPSEDTWCATTIMGWPWTAGGGGRV